MHNKPIPNEESIQDFHPTCSLTGHISNPEFHILSFSTKTHFHRSLTEARRSRPKRDRSLTKNMAIPTLVGEAVLP